MSALSPASVVQVARAKSDPFEVLGVEPSANEQEVKRAYRKLALRCAHIYRSLMKPPSE